MESGRGEQGGFHRQSGSPHDLLGGADGGLAARADDRRGEREERRRQREVDNTKAAADGDWRQRAPAPQEMNIEAEMKRLQAEVERDEAKIVRVRSCILGRSRRQNRSHTVRVLALNPRHQG